MKKKVIAVMLSATMVLSMLSGCGAGADQEVSTPQEVSAQTSEETKEESQAEESKAEESQPEETQEQESAQEESVEESQPADNTGAGSAGNYEAGQEVDYQEVFANALPTDKFLMEGSAETQGFRANVAIGKDGESAVIGLHMGADTKLMTDIILVTGGEKQYAYFNMEGTVDGESGKKEDFYRIELGTDTSEIDELSESMNLEDVTSLFSADKVTKCVYEGVSDGYNTYTVYLHDEDEDMEILCYLDAQTGEMKKMSGKDQNGTEMQYTIRDFDISEYDALYYREDAETIDAENLAMSITGMLFAAILGGAEGLDSGFSIGGLED